MSRLNTFLTGLKIVDLSFYLPGPLASLLLADMGAEVVKVEPPQGEGMRLLGPKNAAGEPVFHAAVNAGKTIRRLDLKQPAGKAALLDLLAEADVLIEGFRSGAMARLGLGPETLREALPQLIYCSLSGYGAEGPLAQAAGHDGNYLAMAGVLHRNGVPPRFFDPPVADVSASLFAALAILGAAEARRRDGKGCHIDLGIADVVMPLQLFQLAGLGATGMVPQPDATYLNGGAAYYRTYATRDGRHLMLGAVEAKFWREFCTAAEQPGWIERQAEPLPQRELIADLDRYFAALTLDTCLARFAGPDCCVSPVLDLAEAVETPHHRARQLVRPGEGALQALFPAWIDGEPPAARKPARTAE